MNGSNDETSLGSKAGTERLGGATFRAIGQQAYQDVHTLLEAFPVDSEKAAEQLKERISEYAAGSMNSHLLPITDRLTGRLTGVFTLYDRPKSFSFRTKPSVYDMPFSEANDRSVPFEMMFFAQSEKDWLPVFTRPEIEVHIFEKEAPFHIEAVMRHLLNKPSEMTVLACGDPCSGFDAREVDTSKVDAEGFVFEQVLSNSDSITEAFLNARSALTEAENQDTKGTDGDTTSKSLDQGANQGAIVPGKTSLEGPFSRTMRRYFTYCPLRRLWDRRRCHVHAAIIHHPLLPSFLLDCSYRCLTKR